MHSVVSLVRDSKVVFKTQHLPLNQAGSQAGEGRGENTEGLGRSLAERARVGCERRALSAREARGSSQVSFDLYLVRTVFLYFSWNGMYPGGAKCILKSIK